ncbi:hypothetical protein HHI36_008048 [Cryptolaemus montrouzieri]|uniref:Uncharacterized protein n=1 Tax=Cryptolaemus montrouzieri TaxID=559131 RepID=A0ABD2MRW2_9CUCU
MQETSISYSLKNIFFKVSATSLNFINNVITIFIMVVEDVDFAILKTCGRFGTIRGNGSNCVMLILLRLDEYENGKRKAHMPDWNNSDNDNLSDDDSRDTLDVAAVLTVQSNSMNEYETDKSGETDQ